MIFFSDKIPKGTHSSVAYHGRTFADVKKSLREKEGLVAVHEAEESKTLGGRVIKTDIGTQVLKLKKPILIE